MELSFDFHSPRAKKARFAENRAKTIKIVCILAIVLFVLTGAGIIYLGNLAVGVFVVTMFVWPTMFLLWQSRELKELKPSDTSLAGLMASDLLGKLPENPTQQDLCRAIGSTVGGRFFAARLGIPALQLVEYVSADAGDTAVVWADAIRIHQNLFDKSDILTSATVLAAICRVNPTVKGMLPNLKIDEDDVVNGAEWFAHLNKLFAQASTEKMTGGIGRDWSFGYTPMLKRYGQNFSEKYANTKGQHIRLESHSELVDRMIDMFSKPGRQNVALIGPVGSGKTTVVEALAERLMDGSANIPKNLQYRQVISLDVTSLISAAPGRGEIEALITRVINEAYSAKNIILCLDNAHLFFEDNTGSVDISNILQPILESGGMRLILAMEEQKFLEISQRNAALAAAINRLQVNPPNEVETMRIIEDNSLTIEATKKVVFMYQALREAYKLSERYVKDIAQPRRSLQVLEGATNSVPNGLVTAEIVRASMETTLGVKIGATDSAEERQQLLNMEDLIHKNMINQTTAVSAVSSALRRARAGVRNEKRPIGTFLFLGPTGVGKSELAKQVSSVYFGGESNMVRLDLNEFVQPEDVSRLIADAASNPNSLSAQISKNPFSVVLLDEIEKAHTNVLSTLLQVLDEGIMRDINNREVSFRDAIIIATSNAGADRIRQYVEAGQSVEKFADSIKDELVNTKQFTPEFLNRFDEIVVFRPLTMEELLQVLDLQIKSVNKTLASQKVSVTVEEDAKLTLVDAGYDPRLGARPMRRVVQQTVENLVSEKLLSGTLQAGQNLNISLEDVKSLLVKKES
jgi:ATPases with chaperone activity, ATP-binding subunit